jgi:DNA-binding PadR family transcriptional regulator
MQRQSTKQSYIHASLIQLLVYQALLNAGDEGVHGYKVAQDLGLKQPPAVYRILAELEEWGWVKQESLKSSRRGPPCRMYRLTAEGRVAADNELRQALQMLGCQGCSA